MPFDFDATLKDIARAGPREFLAALGERIDEPLSLLNVDLSSITTAADLVFGVGDPLREIIHVEVQSAASASKHRDVLAYNVLLHRNYEVAVHSIVVLLRPQAAHSNMNGRVAYEARPGRGRMLFEYELIRLWEIPAGDLMESGVEALPLTLLGRLPEGLELEAGLDSVVQRLLDRLLNVTPGDRARRLFFASFLLCGLRVRRSVARRIFRRGFDMIDWRDSDTYLSILDEGRDEGRVQEAKRILRRQGEKRFGSPSEAEAAALNALEDLDRLELLSDRILDVGSWQELLASS